MIPAEWDEVYTGYASLQQAQGFNLDKLRGKTVTEYTYHITNYPEKDEVAAHILVYKDRIGWGGYQRDGAGRLLHGGHPGLRKWGGAVASRPGSLLQ